MYLTLSIIAAFLMTFILLPVIIKVSRSVDLLDIPDRRKVHQISTPSLGGVAIFIGFMMALLMAVPLAGLVEIKYFLFGLVVIFILGVRDDISSLLAKNKLLTQVFAAVLVVNFTDIKLTGFYGIFGIYEMPAWFHIPLSLFVIVGLTNSFNLIDGIDGLAGSVAVFILSVLGWSFLSIGESTYAVVCISAIGALLAFLFFNWHPSKVFMGDTGSLMLGFMISSLAIKFINSGTIVFDGVTLGGDATVGLAIALLILPIYDTSRVFAIRFRNGKNPLDPDRNHLHHGLLRLGLNHSKATLVLLIFNVIIFSSTLYLSNWMTNGPLLICALGVTVLLTLPFEILLLRKLRLAKSASVSGDMDVYMSKSA
ncbi:MraY family glycosyltransferase [Marinoscillum furvescens]|uniref:UDP-N-acetylmuramyl pentapeptide phosphotransferase/UDP-N-acetylglucosamine-1-phosphate transferase n=1 Tax=Marinoscillum furvescens DSM 4134 TaxID=1122208 RepID=A0A3D9L809_MARFU|nr:MraY family glycosyltransferase [Marinoscillum furvescens]REE01625.1 UDP-N-acetylmuramyl pentapeptide phosphotransferase/UDP-N-acetylglucosamine-1-phosphate transferase [Marinoscillum furvescens DSM 4134]